MKNKNENQPAKTNYTERFKQSWQQIANRIVGKDPYQSALQPPAADSNAQLRAVVEQVQAGRDQVTAGVQATKAAAEALATPPTAETDPDLAMLAGDQPITADDVLNAIDKSGSK